jgi:hypothetical protein
MINRVRCCLFACTVPTFAWRVGTNLGSTKYKAEIRLYTNPTTVISGGAVHPTNCFLWETFHELKLPGNGSVRCSWQAWSHRETVLYSFLFAFHCCISAPLLDCRPCEFPLPPPALHSCEL